MLESVGKGREGMNRPKQKAIQEILKLFQSVGRASLTYDIQDSHSGNMAIKIKDEYGQDEIVVTSTGSQKGDLEPDQICFLSASKTDYGFYRASTETGVHAKILSLHDVQASLHAHAKDITSATLDDAQKPSQPAPFVPLDPLGYYYLGGNIPVDWVAVPSGSPEMAEVVPRRLALHPAMVVQGHGIFSRGRTLKEAFFHACLANNSGYVVRLSRKLDVDIGSLRKKVQIDHASCFQYAPAAYKINDDEICDFPDEREMRQEFFKTGARIFESRLSPFHTGSISVRGVNSMLYAPKASMPREIGGPLLRISLQPEESDDEELNLHKKIYAQGDFRTILHAYVPEAEAHSHFIYPGERESQDRIVPIDAEGSFLYHVIPVVQPNVSLETLIKLLHDDKVVVVRGGGVWAVGYQSLSEVLHHPSSVREICLYRLSAYEQGLDLRKMESQRA